MNRIKELRLEKGLKQIDLCHMIKVSQAALSGYETGKYEPDNATLMQIAELFDVSTDYLLEKTNVKKPPTPEGMDGLTEKQKQLLEVMRQLTPERQDELLRFAAFQAASEQKPE